MALKAYQNTYRPIEEILLFRPVSEFLAQRLVSTRITPNQCTWAGFAITILSALSLAFWFDGSVLERSLVIVALYLSFIFDKIDGDLARSKGIASDRGTYLDSFLDRVGELCLLIGLLISNPGYALWGTLAAASVLLFYYNQTASVAYLHRPSVATYAPHKTLLSRIKDSIAYNRAKHFLIFIAAVAFSEPRIVLFLLPLVFLQAGLVFIKNLFTNS